MFIRPSGLCVGLICEPPLIKSLMRSTRRSPATLLVRLLMHSRPRLARLRRAPHPRRQLGSPMSYFAPGGEYVQSELASPSVRARSDNAFAESFELLVLIVGSGGEEQAFIHYFFDTCFPLHSGSLEPIPVRGRVTEMTRCQFIPGPRETNNHLLSAANLEFSACFVFVVL